MTTDMQTWSKGRIVTAGIVGNVLEWYDFGVYGFFATIIAAQFFPSDNPAASLIAAFGAFAAGFLMRPVGAAIFGHIGDRFGRGRALQLSVLCMAVPTFLIGLLPTYESIGVAAAVLMVLMRMLQGAAVGGEFTSSIVFLAESAPPGRRAFFSCWSMFGAIGGVLLGSAAGAFLTSTLDADALNSWGWRVAFVAGIAVSLVGFIVRRGLVEQPVEVREKPPLVEAFRHHGKDMFMIAGLNVVNAVTFYLIFVYAVTWMVKNVHETPSEALQINTASMVLMLFLVPLFAKFSDAWGRKMMLLLGIGGIAVFAYPLIKVMHHPDPVLILAGQMGIAALAAMFLSSIPAAMTELLPQSVRVTAVSVSYNITLALLGGTSPMVAVWLIERTHDDLSFAWYISLAAVISFIFTLMLKDRRNEPLT
jgi:MHS family proline/betaine transporter-like MFS transporter